MLEVVNVPYMVRRPGTLDFGGGDAAFCWPGACAPGPGDGPLQVNQRPLGAGHYPHHLRTLGNHS